MKTRADNIAGVISSRFYYTDTFMTTVQCYTSEALILYRDSFNFRDLYYMVHNVVKILSVTYSHGWA